MRDDDEAPGVALWGKFVVGGCALTALFTFFFMDRSVESGVLFVMTLGLVTMQAFTD